MSIDQRIRARVKAITAKTGTSFTLRRITRLGDYEPALNPPSASSLLVAAAALAGATSINLDAASVEGFLKAGDTFAIAGNDQAYTVAANNTADNNLFTGVSFTPALVADAAEDAVVTVTFAADTALVARITGYPAHMVDGTNIQATDLRVIVPGSALTSAPAIGDWLLIGSDRRTVQGVFPAYVKDQVGLWNIQAR